MSSSPNIEGKKKKKKNPLQKRAGGAGRVAQGVEALSSNPYTANK
jgi:hypothetical protein